MERGHAMKQQHVLAKFNLSERCCHGGNTECLLNSFASGCKQLVGEKLGGGKYHLLVAREQLINAMTNASKSGGVRAAITAPCALHFLYFLRFCHHYDSLLPARVYTAYEQRK